MKRTLFVSLLALALCLFLCGGALAGTVLQAENYLYGEAAWANFMAEKPHYITCMGRDWNLRGFFGWTFTDNWEWAEGYGPAFGLVHVDRATQRRIPKGSLFWYGRCAQTNSVV